MISRREFALLGLGALGWALFFVSVWYAHRPSTAEVPAETERALTDNGFREVPTGAVPPVAVARKSPSIPGAERVAYVYLSDEPTQEKPPEVRYVAGNCAPGAQQIANWVLRPGDLGLRNAYLDIRRVGRRAFVAASGTLVAQTPDGEVTRTGSPTPDAWVSTRALGIPPRFGPIFRATTLPTAEAGVYWTKGARQWDASAGYDFDRRRWYGAGGVRF